ncbi:MULTISPECIES: hypothetical protein [Paenarthrobacter]|uniref:hypothetical protein n=1 Tax=Paenarthrobacter TaxID=1742992 RepID=UPI000FEC7992|nr:hypothetical protein [Paenarthrobacter ureafaciens]RWW94724.1 hypothetical protein AUR_09010 [Paenarthrobacter ureafaciens]
MGERRKHRDAYLGRDRWVSEHPLALGDEVRLVLERETPVKVRVRDERGVIEFHVWSRWEGMAGELIVRVGEHVSVHDTLLRT